MIKLSFRIRKKYFDLIVAGKKAVELRRDIMFWRIRVNNILGNSPGLWEALDERSFIPDVPVQAVFVCGKEIHRREIRMIARIKTPVHLFSDQGKKDVNTEKCFAFFLGDVVNE